MNRASSNTDLLNCGTPSNGILEHINYTTCGAVYIFIGEQQFDGHQINDKRLKIVTVDMNNNNNIQPQI